MGVFDRDFAISNVYSGLALISRNRSDLASSNACRRFRPFAGFCRFFYFNDTRNGTRRDVLGEFLPRDCCASATAAIFLEAFPRSLNATAFMGDLSLRPPVSPIYSQRLSLTPGTRLGPYEVVSAIGAGGMGEVYRARDTKLNRDVALKVLPDLFASDPDRLARFTREAQTLASLNHPNIAHIHGLEESGGVRALVMELVEGEDLSQRIARGAIAIDEALPIAKQIAEALEAAHELGIVHRDLKPANIKVRADGTVKVLDFGLAKAIEPVPMSDIANSPTITSPAMTAMGMILGTAAYMSPEQARGKPVDKRADIWAFGVVLYEMLTGRRVFEGEDVSLILAAVIQSDPRWDGVPANVRRLLESCLEKDPKKRLRDIGDVWKLLDGPPAVPIRTRTGVLGWAAAGLLALLAAVAVWAPWRDTPAPAVQSVLRLEADLGNDVSLVPLAVPTISSVVISPDATRLVYVGTISGGPAKLLTRRLDQPNITELAGTEGARNPFFSRDGKWVAFWNGREIYKAPVDGGGPVRLGEFGAMTGGDWGDEDTLVIGTAGSPQVCCGCPQRGVPEHRSWSSRMARGSIHIRRFCRVGRRCSFR